MKISEQSHLSIYKIEAGTGQQAPAGKSQDNLPFAPGQLIKGTVAGFTGDGKVLLDVGGQTITAKTLVPLTLGSELWLETGKSGSSPLLTLAAKKGAVQDFLKLLLAGAPLSSSNSRGLSDLFSALLPELASQSSPGAQVTTGSLLAAMSGSESFPEAVKMLTMLLGGPSGAQKEIAQLLEALNPTEAQLQPGHAPGGDKLTKILVGTQKEIAQILDVLNQNKAMLRSELEPGMEKLLKIATKTQQDIVQLLEALSQNKAILSPLMGPGLDKLMKILAGTQKEIIQFLDALDQKAAGLKPGLEPTTDKLLKILAGTQKDIVQLLEALDQKAAGLKPGLEPSADKLLKILAAHQQINSQPPQTNEQNFLLFPCFFAGNAGWGEWIFSMEKQADQDREEKYNLAFFLEMSNLGPLALQATIAGKTITGQFLLSSEKARAHVADHVQELARILGGQGYQPASFTCLVNKKNMISQLKETLQEKAAIRRFSLLDVSA